MSEFQLIPFPGTELLPSIDLHGTIDRQAEILTIEYYLTGDLNSIVIPKPNPHPTRQSELWEHTCLEFFIGARNDRSYWEFNLAPSGDWNVFHLDDYRQGLSWEDRVQSLPFNVARSTNTLALKLAFDLSQVIPIDRHLEVAITAVIESTVGAISYWALTHTGTEADFHRRDSFIVSIE
jgi:hypothetical protein